MTDHTDIAWDDAIDIADDATMGEDISYNEYDTITIDGVQIPVSSISSTELSRFESKVTFGDYNVDSDQQASSYIVNSWQAGALTDDHTEGADDSSFRWANAWTFSPQQLTLNPSINVHPLTYIPNGGVQPTSLPKTVPLAEWNGGLYVAAGNRLYKITGADSPFTVTYIGTLAGTPCDRGVVFGNPEEGTVRLWIPIYRDEMNPNYVLQTVTPANVINSPDEDHPAVSICSWDKRLYALLSDGHVAYYSQTGTWNDTTGPNPDLYIGGDQQPRRITTFYNRSGQLTVFVSTDRQVWELDAENSVLIEYAVRVPWSPYNGYGLNAWNDDAIYFSNGIGVSRYSNAGVRTFTGLDRQDGIPASQFFADGAGIMDIIPAYNFFIAAIDAGTYVGTDSIQYRRTHICAYDDVGWHVIATWDRDVAMTGMGLQRHIMYITEVTGGYRLWIGSQDTTASEGGNSRTQMRSIRLPKNAFGPKQSVLQQTYQFQSSGWVEQGWFDASMEGFEKLASHFEVNLDRTSTGTGPSGYVDVYYRIDTNDAWTYLGRADKFGRNVLPFGLDGSNFPKGLYFQRIDFRLELRTTNTAQSPVVRYTNLKFIKMSLPAKAWVFNVPLDREILNQGQGPTELDKFLAAMTYSGGFNHVVIRDRHFRARVSQWLGSEALMSPDKNGQLSMVELKIPGYTLPDPVEN